MATPLHEHSLRWSLMDFDFCHVAQLPHRPVPSPQTASPLPPSWHMSVHSCGHMPLVCQAGLKVSQPEAVVPVAAQGLYGTGRALFSLSSCLNHVSAPWR